MPFASLKMKIATSGLTVPSKSPAAEAFGHLRKATLRAVLDHARAGNDFLVRVFDQYLPFHLTKWFGKGESVAGLEIFEFLETYSN